MSDERRILRNTVILTLGEALGQLANLVFVAAFARCYGVAIMGQYSLAMAIGAVASLVVGFGTQGYLLRELSQSPELAARRVATLAPWQFGMALGAGLLVALVIAIRGQGSLVMLATIAYQLLYRVAGLYYVAFRAREQMLVPVLAELAHRLMTLLLGAVLMWSGAGAAATLLALFGSAAALALAGYLAHRRASGPAAPADHRGEARRLFKASWPFFGTLVLAVVYARGAPILLGLVRGTEAVGGYAVADRLLVAATLVPVMFGNAALPALSRLARGDAAQRRSFAARLLRLMLVGTLPLAAVLVVFADEILLLVFGPSYRQSVPLLRILALGVPVQGVELLLAAQLSAIGSQQALLRNRLVSLSAFLVLGPVLVHLAGATGLATVVLAGSLLQMSGCALLLARLRESPLSARTAWAPIAAAVVAALTTLLVGDRPLSVRSLVFVATLLLAAWTFGAVRGHDLAFARSLLRQGRAAPRRRDLGDPAA
jgi:PST family polysaccharide transporter